MCTLAVCNFATTKCVIGNAYVIQSHECSMSCECCGVDVVKRNDNKRRFSTRTPACSRTHETKHNTGKHGSQLLCALRIHLGNMHSLSADRRQKMRENRDEYQINMHGTTRNRLRWDDTVQMGKTRFECDVFMCICVCSDARDRCIDD